MKNIMYLMLLFSFSSVFSQVPDNLNKDLRSRIFIPQNNNIEGKDYLFKEWNNGMLVLNDTVFSNQKYLKYDAFRDRVLIKKSNQIIEITDRSLTGFSILAVNSNFKHDFVKLNSTDFIGGSKDGFYEVVYNEQKTNYFIKKESKVIYDPNRSKGSQTINNYPLKYDSKTDFFIKNDAGLYVKVRLNKKDINTLLSKNSKRIKQFIKDEKINYRKEEDVLKLVNYYYSL